uniref:Uncharacterized protein n=1 Tax=Arundo donax TaxID=35708 RepID=A0A0A8ZC97_ARUDO
MDQLGLSILMTTGMPR